MKICKYCQKENIDDAKFCRECGKTLLEDISQKESSSYLTVVIIIILFFIIFIIVCAIAYTNKSGYQPENLNNDFENSIAIDSDSVFFDPDSAVIDPDSAVIDSELLQTSSDNKYINDEENKLDQITGCFYTQNGNVVFKGTNNSGYKLESLTIICVNKTLAIEKTFTVDYLLNGAYFTVGVDDGWLWQHGEQLGVTFSDGSSIFWRY